VGDFVVVQIAIYCQWCLSNDCCCWKRGVPWTTPLVQSVCIFTAVWTCQHSQNVQHGVKNSC